MAAFSTVKPLQLKTQTVAHLLCMIQDDMNNVRERFLNNRRTLNTALNKMATHRITYSIIWKRNSFMTR